MMDLDKVAYWSDLSDYDFDTADAMWRTGRWKKPFQRSAVRKFLKRQKSCNNG